MRDKKEPIDAQPSDISQLRGTEGGRWEVQTKNSVHLFDHDAGTITRTPGPN
jgi:hypothetical protein